MTDAPLTSATPRYSYDMAAAPTGRKLIAANHSGVACFAILTEKNKKDFMAWCPMPKFPKKEPP